MYKEQQHHMVTGLGVTALFIKGWTYARQGFFFRRFYIELIIAVGKFGQFFRSVDVMQTPFFNSPQFDECGGIKTDNPLPDKTVKVMSQGDKSVITAYGLMVLMVF